MEHLPWEQNSELSKAIEKISALEVISLRPTDVTNLYISLLQNSVFQAMTISILRRDGLISAKDAKILDDKNTEYHHSINNFFLSVANRIDSNDDPDEVLP